MCSWACAKRVVLTTLHAAGIVRRRQCQIGLWCDRNHSCQGSSPSRAHQTAAQSLGGPGAVLAPLLTSRYACPSFVILGISQTIYAPIGAVYHGLASDMLTLQDERKIKADRGKFADTSRFATMGRVASPSQRWNLRKSSTTSSSRWPAGSASTSLPSASGWPEGAGSVDQVCMS